MVIIRKFNSEQSEREGEAPLALPMEGVTRAPIIDSPRKIILPSSALGMFIFIICEVMLFAALISAYLVTSAGALNWPPPDQPRLPITLTAINTFFLLVSGILLWRAYLNFKKSIPPSPGGRGSQGDFLRSLGGGGFFLSSIFLGTLFVTIQGIEWTRLISYELTMTSSVYGAFFYLIIGMHALHALGAITGLLVMYNRLRKGKLTHDAFLAISFLWYFVVLVWPLLYGVIYF